MKFKFGSRGISRIERLLRRKNNGPGTTIETRSYPFARSNRKNSIKLGHLIDSLDDFKSKTKKLSTAQTKVFGTMYEWALDTNNSAIQDVTNRLDVLFSKIETELVKDKLISLKDITRLFKKFKEHDASLAKFGQATKVAERVERKCLHAFEKCPISKNIRDYEIQYERAKENRERAELKYYDYTQEIDATKTILFKTQMKRLRETLSRQNEAEKVLLTAMARLIEQIPDVSSHDVDDLNQIDYKRTDHTAQICVQAKRRITRLSSSNLNPENENNENDHEIDNDLLNPKKKSALKGISSTHFHYQLKKEEREEKELPILLQVPNNKSQARKPKKRISCPPQLVVLGKIDENVSSISSSSSSSQSPAANTNTDNSFHSKRLFPYLKTPTMATAENENNSTSPQQQEMIKKRKKEEEVEREKEKQDLAISSSSAAPPTYSDSESTFRSITHQRSKKINRSELNHQGRSSSTRSSSHLHFIPSTCGYHLPTHNYVNNDDNEEDESENAEEEGEGEGEIYSVRARTTVSTGALPSAPLLHEN